MIKLWIKRFFVLKQKKYIKTYIGIPIALRKVYIYSFPETKRICLKYEYISNGFVSIF